MRTGRRGAFWRVCADVGPQPDATDGTLLERIDADYTCHPFYGSRKLVHTLRGLGYTVNRKRVQRLMRVLGLAGMVPDPNTSRPHPTARGISVPAARRND